jgi:hypothetical protein
MSVPIKTRFLAVLFILILVSCRESTQLADGKMHSCVGWNNKDREIYVQYRLSKRNVAIGILFSETIIVPALVVLTQLYCPDSVSSKV